MTRKMSDVEAVAQAIGYSYSWKLTTWEREARAVIACLRRRGWRNPKAKR